MFIIHTMGVDIDIVGADDKLTPDEREVYHATYGTTGEFSRESPAFDELSNFLGDDTVIITPGQFVPLIPKFEQEKLALEQQGKTTRGKDIGRNAITLYDCVAGCYEGLKKAQELGASLRIH